MIKLHRMIYMYVPIDRVSLIKEGSYFSVQSDGGQLHYQAQWFNSEWAPD